MDLKRPSALALTGHDDHYCWIELMARCLGGDIVRKEFVRIRNQQRIKAFAGECNGTGLVACHSICIYTEPDRRSRYAVPFYLHVHCPDDLEKARKCLIESGEQVLIAMEAAERSLCPYFDGDKGFDLVVPFQVFDGFYSPWIFPLYAAVAKQHAGWNPGLIEQSIYSEEYMLTLPGSRHAGTGLYKVRLCWDEVRELSADQLRQLAASPCPEDSYLEASVGKCAPWWFTGALKRIETEIPAQRQQLPASVRKACR